MFNWFILTIWIEYNNKLTMKHIPNFKYIECQTAITELIEDFENKNPNKKIKYPLCKQPCLSLKSQKTLH